jgi:glycosyltransferase involved in cell wall biosynthesis
MATPVVSVVIPTFNRQEALRAAIRSVLSQTYRDFEIIVVDDGSTDRTAEAVAALTREQADGQLPRMPIRYVFQANEGQSAARNKGCSLAHGSWISFLDSDDIWLPEKLERQTRALDRWGSVCGVCVTDARLIDSAGLDVTAFRRAGMAFGDETGRVPDVVHVLARRFGGIWLQTLLVRKHLFEGIGGFDASLHFAEDHDLLFRLSLVTDFVYVNLPLAVIDRTSRTSDAAAPPREWDAVEVRLRGEQQRLEKWLRLRKQYSSETRRIVRRNLRGIHSNWANWHLERDQFASARRAAATALRCYVTPVTAVKWVLVATMPRLAKRIAPRSTKML